MEPSTFNLLTLKFTDDQVEEKFNEVYEKSLLTVDENFYLIQLVSQIVFDLGTHFKFLKTTNDGYFWMVAYTFAVVLNGIAVYVVPRNLYKKYRTYILLAMRIIFAYPSAFMVPEYSFSAGPSQPRLIMRIVMSSCSLMLIWTPLGMPIKFRQFVAMQVLTWFWFAYTINGRLCASLLEDPSVESLIQASWRQLDSVASATLAMVVPAGAMLSEGPIPPLPQPPEPSSCSMCFSLVLFVQLVVGFLGPICIMYQVELNARMLFAQQWAYNNVTRWQQQQQPNQVIKMVLYVWMGGLVLLAGWNSCVDFTALSRSLNPLFCGSAAV